MYLYMIDPNEWTLEKYYEKGGEYYSGLENLKKYLNEFGTPADIFSFLKKENKEENKDDFDGDKRMKAIYKFFKKQFEGKVNNTDNVRKRQEIYNKIYEQNQDAYRHNIWNNKTGRPSSKGFSCSQKAKAKAYQECIAENQQNFINIKESAEEKKANSEKIQQKNRKKIACSNMGPNHTWVEAESDDQKKDGFINGVCKIKNKEGTPGVIGNVVTKNGGRKKKRKSRRRKTKKRRKTKRKSRRRKSRRRKSRKTRRRRRRKSRR